MFLGQNLYFYLNHPIKWVRLVGVIVAVDIYPTRWILLLDDNSGATVEITCGRPTPTYKDAEHILPTVGDEARFLPDPVTQGLTATGRSISLEAVDLGTVVKVKGGLGTFRDEKQLLLERISILKTTNDEAYAWAENTDFREGVLSKPWVVSKKDEEQARRKAEGIAHKERSQGKRKRTQTIQPSMRQQQFGQRARKSPARQINKRKQIGVDLASNKEKDSMMHLRDKRAEDKLLRERVFEELKLQRECPKQSLNIVDTPATHKEKSVHGEQARFGSQRREGDIRSGAPIDSKEQARMKRVKERQLRELEFRRLQEREETKKLERTV